MLTDRDIRNLALDVSKSFIVQAPAGSGKTALLIERYLTLLAKVTHPEEILAITFTRKAAGEMRSRIISTLKNPTTSLAKSVLAQNESKKWNLLESPHRLRIQTIDAFCHYLVKQTPLLVSGNTRGKIIQNSEADMYYAMAAENLLRDFENPEYAEYLKNLLLYLDNDWNRAAKLFLAMLRVRDQWLPHIVGLKNMEELRKKMEKELATIEEEYHGQIIAHFPTDLYQELQNILREIYTVHEDPPAFLEEILAAETIEASSIAAAKSIALLCLTKEFNWRKKITTEQGFPNATNKEAREKQCKIRKLKLRMETLLQNLASHEKLRLSLENLSLAPPINYQNFQWKIIESLLKLLPLLTAHLKIIFSQEQIADHIEITMAAINLLEDSENPTDLALNLDYFIQHLLVDEFQDTSIAHYRLIEKLIAGWHEEDGHTLFLVGDPMQSIYRFRAAEVGLFLKVQRDGIANLKPQPIFLDTNFRSATNIVNWINEIFTKIIPQNMDVALGQVPFKASKATAIDNDAEVTLSLLQNGTPSAEAKATADIIKSIKKMYPHDSIAILVKAKSHLQYIIKELEKSNLDYQALELEHMEENLLISDLFSLTRALFDLNDAIAWIAILRAPWCGLTLGDIYQIARKQEHTIWHTISDPSCQTNLSQSGYQRLTIFITRIAPFIKLIRKLNWRMLVKKCWLAIGGPATAHNLKELQDADVYFELIDNNLSIEKLKIKLSSLYTSTNNLAAKIIAMTIHRAKGLEFDHVIIPAINRTTKIDEHKLLLWCERPKLHGESGLILAPLGSSQTKDQIYNYLKTLEQKRNFYETGRLLYVAITRAKKSAHLLGITDNITPPKFPSGSLLEQLKPMATKIAFKKSPPEQNIDVVSEPSNTPQLTRLVSSWNHPMPMQSITPEHNFKLELLDNQDSILGIVIHQILSLIDLEKSTADQIVSETNYWSNLLKQEGYLNVTHGIEMIRKAMVNILNDERGRWILNNHSYASNELKISTVVSGISVNYVIDRTFIDNNGVRWIIDYKTSALGNNELCQFLTKEASYHARQMQNYKNAMEIIDSNHPIRTGLYFPMFCGWIENT